MLYDKFEQRRAGRPWCRRRRRTYAYAPSGPASVRPHAPPHIGERAFTYDANGNQTRWDHDQNGTRRNIVWDDENRIQSLFDNGAEKTYKYDDQGQRIIKRGPQGETVYVNQFYTDRPGATGTKHIYAGTTRIASKMLRQDTPGANPNGKTPFEKDIYFYHPDHLGSSSYITDLNGKLYEALIYFPFGEGWIEENTNVQRTPFHFTSKELDEETGLYYFGARYYDPRTSVWQSADPILGKYLPVGDKQRDQNLAGLGGAFNPHNLNLYGYAHLNPIRLNDPDGNATAVAGCAVGGGIGAFFAGIGAVPGCVSGAAIATAVTGIAAGAVLAWAWISSSSSNDSDDAKSKTAPQTTPTPITAPASPMPPEDPDQDKQQKSETSKKSEIPQVQNSKLQNYVNDFFKGIKNPNKIGSGTTADAVRYETATGQQVGGKWHFQKAGDLARGLEKWLRNNPSASASDRAIAQQMLQDLRSALNATPP